jgi:hypothetical protein
MNPITYNLVFDWERLEFAALGRNGRLYSTKEIEEAQAAAERGDEDAMATMAVLDHTGVSQEEMMASCPCCREETERTGKAPEVLASWDSRTDPPFEEVSRDPSWWMGRKRRRRARHRGRR